MRNINENGKRIKMLAKSVKETLSEDFGIPNDVKIVSNNMLQLCVNETYAERTMRLMEHTYCEHLALLMYATADKVTTFTYAC